VVSAFLHPFARPARTDWITVVRGEGAVVWDDRGRRLVDGFAGLWYCNVGHGRAEIAEAMAAQARRLASYSAFDRFTNEPAEMLAARLAATTPIADARVFFTSSGSEAMDSAVKIVRIAHQRAGDPDRTIVLSRHRGYHGVTYGVTSLQGLALNREGFGPLLEHTGRIDDADLADAEAAFAADGERIAAVVAEPVIGAGGIHPPSPGYLEGLRRLCDEHGAFLVFDEVVCAFGRVGHWWGAERYGVVPDAQTFAKGVTSGYVPLGGVVLGRRVLDPLEADPDWMLRHGHTYSGHATCCAAALANLDLLESEGLLARADAIGAHLGDALGALEADGRITEVRGVGAMWGFTLPDGMDGSALMGAMIDRGVIARMLADGRFGFCPPLCIDEADLDHCIEALDSALGALT
jgi:putrescine---pyruvate transaminase